MNRDPRLVVVADTAWQFEHWCTARGWSPRDSGIVHLPFEAHRLQGIRFVPGDLVIELEVAVDMTQRWTAAARAYERIKLWAQGVGFRRETTIPERDWRLNLPPEGECPDCGAPVSASASAHRVDCPRAPRVPL